MSRDLDLATLEAAGVVYGELPDNPPCGCGCNWWQMGDCPIPSKGLPSRWCANAESPELPCRCIALGSQGLCEGCYVATK